MIAVKSCLGCVSGLTRDRARAVIEPNRWPRDWTDYTSTAALLSVILKNQGWTVKNTELSDNAPLYAGMSSPS